MSNFVDELVELNEDKVIDLTEERIQSGEDPTEIIADFKTAVKEIGDQFERDEYFLPELTMAGEILEQILGIVKPELEGEGIEEEKKGKILLGTVKDDIHDIGKNVVRFMLDTNGYEVLDIGVDVSPEEFVENIEKENPDILALSGLLTLAYDSMKETVQEVENSGFRDSLKIMIGGGSTDESIVEYTKADAYGDSAVEAVNLADEWMEGKYE